MSKYHELFSGQLPVDWRVSAACSTSTCVAVLDVGPLVLVRDSKNGSSPDQPVIEFSKNAWHIFNSSVAQNQDDVSRRISAGGVEVSQIDAETVTFRSIDSGVVLVFTLQEWQAFAKGVVAGEFSFVTATPV